MGRRKVYADQEMYEKKLERVMARFQVDDYDYNYDRHGAWVRFNYKGQAYLFEHTIERARERGIALQYGSDAFAQLVLALEDLARMIERGIYDLSQWIVGMKHLPPADADLLVLDCFRTLQFETIPESTEEVDQRYRQLAKILHPDVEGGSNADFIRLNVAYHDCIQYMGRK